MTDRALSSATLRQNVRTSVSLFFEPVAFVWTLLVSRRLIAFHKQDGEASGRSSALIQLLAKYLTRLNELEKRLEGVEFSTSNDRLRVSLLSDEVRILSSQLSRNNNHLDDKLRRSLEEIEALLSEEDDDLVERLRHSRYSKLVA